MATIAPFAAARYNKTITRDVPHIYSREMIKLAMTSEPDAIAASEVRRILAEEARLDQLTPGQRIAEQLHGRLCKKHHPCACNWSYSSWSHYERDSARQHYRSIAARMLIAVHDEAAIARIIDCL